MPGRLSIRIVLAVALVTALASPAFAADTLKVGILKVPQALFVGIEKGYFAAEGLEVQPLIFRSGAELVAPLSTGQIDAAATSPGAALFNAMARGVKETIVADHMVSFRDTPSGDTAFIVVRKDLVTSGRYKAPADAKGMTIAITAKGQFTDLFAHEFLRSAGLSETDVKIVSLPYPDMVAAMQNKAIDLAVQVEPFVTEEEEHGTAQRIVGLSQLMPGFVQAVTMYGERLGKRDRALGERFMRALVKSNMYLRQALTTPSGRAEIARIYQKYVPLDNPALYERLGLANGPPTLAVDVEGKYGLRWQLQQYAQEGLIQHQPDMNGAVDTAFAASVARK